MKKWIILIIIAVAAGFGLMSSYNGLVKAETEIDSVWANVESSYQRRADLIPNLVNTVKGQANFEQQTLTNVIEARAKATQTKIDPSNEGFMNLQAQLEGTENRINVARNKFNEAARIYNEKVRQFPTKLAAMIFGFKAKPYFKSAAGAENAPTVNFN